MQPSRLFLAAAALVATSMVVSSCRIADPVVTVPAAQALPAPVRDLAYGPATGCVGPSSDAPCGGSQTLDVYLPTAGGNRGVLVYVHGGGFVGGDKTEVTALGNLSRQTTRGYAVVSVNYRLAKPASDKFPTPVADVAQALRWIRANGAAHGLNPAKLVLAGHSAGGTLASLVALGANSGRAEYANIPRVNGWVSVAGIMHPKAGPYSNFWLRQLVPEPFDVRSPAATPVMLLDPADPPGFVVHGDLDTVVEFANVTWVENVLRLIRAEGLVTVDVVDRSAAGPLPAHLRGHEPFGGMNAAEFDTWIDAR